jgi:hypothetical protein
VSRELDSLLFAVPRRLIVKVDGCPTNIAMVTVKFDSLKNIITLETPAFQSSQTYALQVDWQKITKAVEKEGVPAL